MTIESSKLDLYKELLLKRKADAEVLIKSFEQGSKTVDLDEPIGRLTRMDAIQQQHLAKAKKHQAVQRINKIDEALKKISEGTYGICVGCEEVIDEKRLKAMPEALHCIECHRQIV
ncbi:hypothetical protein GW916_00325 [bacterium]|nr:hypothetical protein [bacterium]